MQRARLNDAVVERPTVASIHSQTLEQRQYGQIKLWATGLLAPYSLQSETLSIINIRKGRLKDNAIEHYCDPLSRLAGLKNKEDKELSA